MHWKNSECMITRGIEDSYITIFKGGLFINIINKNLLKSELDIIAQQVNCKGVMGAGLALQIKIEFPEVFKQYKELCKEMDYDNLLGRCQIVATNSKDVKYIGNIFGQASYGRGLRTNYQALEKGLNELKVFAKDNNLLVGLPYGIGCGLAGGNWDIVLGIIERVFGDYPVTICKLDL